MKKKRYRWNYKKCFKNLAFGIAFLITALSFPLAMISLFIDWSKF